MPIAGVLVHVRLAAGFEFSLCSLHMLCAAACTKFGRFLISLDADFRLPPLNVPLLQESSACKISFRFFSHVPSYREDAQRMLVLLHRAILISKGVFENSQRPPWGESWGGSSNGNAPGVTGTGLDLLRTLAQVRASVCISH
jgi:hypothetical protein